MKELKMGLLTNKYKKVYHEEHFKYNAPHHFEVWQVDGNKGNLLGKIDFQEGAIKECGVNGVMNEDLICMVLARLESFQKCNFQCRENAIAITKLEEALLWLRKRTIGREERGVEGTHEI